MFQICDYLRSDFSVYTCLFYPENFGVKFRHEKKCLLLTIDFLVGKWSVSYQWPANFDRRG